MAKESLLESYTYHTVIFMTLSLSKIKDLRSSFLIFTPKNSQLLKPQNLLQLLPILIYFSSEIKTTNNNITTKLYDKRDGFGFHIVNFPFMSSNIPSAPAPVTGQSNSRFKIQDPEIKLQENKLQSNSSSKKTSSSLIQAPV